MAEPEVEDSTSDSAPHIPDEPTTNKEIAAAVDSSSSMIEQLPTPTPSLLDKEEKEEDSEQREITPPKPSLPNRTVSAASDSGDSQEFGITTLPSLELCLYGLETADDLSNTEEENAAINPIQPGHVIDLKYLRKLASKGIPDEGSHRGNVWRLLLGYLPPETDKWPTVLEESRSFYKSLVEDLFADTYDSKHGDSLRWRPRRRQQQQQQRTDSLLDSDENTGMDENGAPEQSDDSSSSASETSLEDVQLPSKSPWGRPDPVLPEVPECIKEAWKNCGKDPHLLQKMMTSVNALKISDKARGRPEAGENDALASERDEEGNDVWQRAAKDFVESAVLLDEVRKDVDRTHPHLAFFLDPVDDLGQRRYYALERILFVWATYNKGVRYVQGMNEIVGAIYYVLAKDWKPHLAAEAEADAYYLFSTLLSEMRDVFVPDLDDADTGIQGRLAHMQKLLQLHDPEVKEHLDEIEIDVSYYAFRWWTTLLSREFLLPDTIRLWDSMFASTHKDNFMRYACVTMVLIIRDKLLKSEFSTCIKLLQNYPPCHMDNLIESSRALWIYETQVTLAMRKGGFSRHMALQAIKPPPGIIMAFGFREGVAPNVKSRSEKIKEDGGKAAGRMREATTAVASSARTYFGKATDLFNSKATGLLNNYRSRIRTASADSAGPSRSSSDGEEAIGFSEDKLKAFDDDEYLAEFMSS